MEIPELNPIPTGDIDVFITYGKTPPHLNNVLTTGVLFEASSNEFLLKLPLIGSFYAYGGVTITIDPNSGAKEDELRLFLLGSVMGAILYQRGYTPMHGSANVIDGEAMLIIGNSAAGKSTLAASLNKDGFPLMSDDLSAISISKSGQCVLLPGIPLIKLWEDSRNFLYSSGSYRQIRPLIKKYIIPTSDIVQNEHIINKIIWLTTKNNNGIFLQSLKGAKKMMVLRDHIYRDQLIRGIGLVEHQFRALSILANQIELFHVDRPVIPFSVNELKEFVYNKILKI